MAAAGTRTIAGATGPQARAHTIRAIEDALHFGSGTVRCLPSTPSTCPTPLEMEPVAAFLIGVVGMVACQAAINAVTAVRDMADDFVEHGVDQD